MNSKRTFLITGASKGIGYATAMLLLADKYDVVGIARHKPEKEFKGDFYIADLADPKATEEIFAEIKKTHQIDGIVNNVGTAIPAPIGKINVPDLQTVIDLNLRPALQAVQTFMQGMIERKFGRIVNISSRASQGAVTLSTYSAAKAGLIALTRSWALELATTGITVNSVAPGLIATESFCQYVQPGSERAQMMLKNIPLGRFGEPKEIAAMIAFLLSDDAAFITGQTFFVDGGASIK